MSKTGVDGDGLIVQETAETERLFEDDKNGAVRKKSERLSFLSLFRYTTRNEKLQMTFACVCAVLHGTVLPLFTILFGNVITAFSEDSISKVAGISKWFVFIGIGAAILAFLQIRFQLVAAQQVGARMRSLYFKSLMRQDAAWHEGVKAGALVTRINDIQLIQAGIGDKLTIALQYVSMFIVGFIVAFSYSWKMTLAVLATTPFLAITAAIMAKLTADGTEDGLDAYSAAGSVASEAISMIKTVTAFGAQKEEEERYEKELNKAYKSEVRKGFTMGIGLGLVMLCFLCIFGFSLWFGNFLFKRKQIRDVGTIFTVFFSVVIGASGIGQAGPSFNTISIALGAAPEVFKIIERESNIDSMDLSKGKIPLGLDGSITFKNVTFNYPSRPASEPDLSGSVLDKFNISIPAGSTQALVGQSGSGKSTVARIVERFYDITRGQVLIGGEDIRNLNVSWLRGQIGYVGQMPTLFALSIRDNIALGGRISIHEDALTGKKSINRTAPTFEEIVEAAKLANADKFIRGLPEGYDTVLGERGAMLSGGQKQRICIARALVRNPKILILDEATASLDAQSEGIVQEAIENATGNRSITTIVIAHRLSTVRDADQISVLYEGKIVEEGSHSDLMSKNGTYKRLIEIQNVSGKVPDKNESPDSQNFVEDAPLVDISEKIHDRKDEEEEEEKDDDNLNQQVLVRAFKYNKSEAVYIVLGLIGAAMAGSSWPLSAIVLSKVTARLPLPDNQSDIRFFALMFFVIGCVALVGNILQLGCLGISGNRLTRKIRKETFRSILRQDMSFFDSRENNSGSLTTMLASEAGLVRGVTGDTLGVIAVAISTLGSGLIIAFIGCWRIALSILVVVPGVAVAGAMEMKMMTGFDTESEKEFSKSASTASEALDGISTVNALGVQDYFIEKFDKSLEKPKTLGKKKALITSVAFGFSELAQFLIWAVAFWVGSIFVKRGQCTFEGMMIGVTGLIFGAATLGNIAVFMPDIGASKVATAKIFAFIDKKSKIDPVSTDGFSPETIQGSVDIKNAKFEYPTRFDVPVLRGLSISVEPGKTLALVGESGCGKSTVVSLLQRYYDVREGQVEVDQTNVKDYHVQNLRSHMGIVAQEPDLFNRTVKENICYGLANQDGAPITESMIEDAAKEANAHEFIMNLPEKYDTIVGARGDNLSGGQKQRVAIARSIIRQPNILLLDEATSALDAESERIAQDALDKAASSRTTILVAHRLSTIKSADSIALISKGEVVEQGTHEELLKMSGLYAELIRNQLNK